MFAKAEPELTFDGTGKEFTSLEEKIYRTIELLKHAREAKAAAERDVSRLREQWKPGKKSSTRSRLK